MFGVLLVAVQRRISCALPWSNCSQSFFGSAADKHAGAVAYVKDFLLWWASKGVRTVLGLDARRVGAKAHAHSNRDARRACMPCIVGMCVPGHAFALGYRYTRFFRGRRSDGVFLLFFLGGWGGCLLGSPSRLSMWHLVVSILMSTATRRQHAHTNRAHTHDRAHTHKSYIA